MVGERSTSTRSELTESRSMTHRVTDSVYLRRFFRPRRNVAGILSVALAGDRTTEVIRFSSADPFSVVMQLVEVFIRRRSQCY
jgi:hypothetical protein